MTSFNTLIAHTAASRSVALMAKAKELQATDPSVINLTGGEPDFPTPEAICRASADAMNSGYTHYTDSRGNLDLRLRLARKLAEENNAPYHPDNILITPGGKMAIYLAVRALLNPGDEAIWLTPGWVSYPSIIEVSGGVPVAVHLKYEENYCITVDALEAAASPRTRLLILNYPNNPTGRILTPQDIAALSEFLRRHPEIYVVSDEVYEKIVYGGARVVSMASIPEFFERVVVANSFSKTSAMTGWRIGYLACNPELYRVIHKLFQHTVSCVSGFLQKGALVALDLPEATETMRAAYERRRNMLLAGIAEIPGVEFSAPDGAFYAWLRFADFTDSEALAEDLLDRAKIAGVPGSSYGEEHDCCVRFSFASSDRELAAFLAGLKDYMSWVSARNIENSQP